MIQLRGVSKRFGATVALRPTDLSVGASETVALLGTSGSGKSTLLRCVLRLVVPDTGIVDVGGETVTDQNALAQRRRMGYVIQGGGLFPHLTARQNAALLAVHGGWDRARVDARVQELADLVRLPLDLFDRFPIELSGGQRQRVALVRALFLAPDVLLLDEPLGALDPVTRDDLQQDLRRLVRDLGTTVLLVTHSLREASVLADRVAVMDRGEIVQRGRLDAIADAPATPFVARFVDSQRVAL
jgi:osmoprotectant transport system ATP-binding protein